MHKIHRSIPQTMNDDRTSAHSSIGQKNHLRKLAVKWIYPNSTLQEAANGSQQKNHQETGLQMTFPRCYIDKISDTCTIGE